MEWWQAVILGLVEGITEYLPVSSTGHLIITNALLGLDAPADVKAAADTFAIVVQGGAILAVLGLYRKRVLQMIKGVLGKDAVGLRLAINLLIAFIPAVVLGLLLDEWIEANLFNTPSVLLALALGGVWMIWLDRWREKKAKRAGVAAPEGEGEAAHELAREKIELSIEDVDWKRALGIGLMQCVAMWPGTSRSMMTIAGGTLLGMKPKDAAEFSFLLGLPTLGGACVYKLWKNLNESSDAGAPNFIEQLGLMSVLIGVAVATVSAALAVKWLVGFLNKHGLSPFGWYRLALCVVLGGLIVGGLVSL